MLITEVKNDVVQFTVENEFDRLILAWFRDYPTESIDPTLTLGKDKTVRQHG